VETSGDTRAASVHAIRDFDAIRAARQVFAARLREFLSTTGMSLHAVARTVGVTVSAVHHWKSGTASPGTNALSQLSGVGFDVQMPPTSASFRTQGDNPITKWLKSLGLWGKSAHHKRVPDVIFELPREQLALFLNRAFACDGSIYVQNGDQVGISYSTVSEVLARDMQHLLLRFGLIAKLRKRSISYRGTRRPAFELRIVRQEDIARFVNEIGIFGKEEQASAALRVSLAKQPKVNLDVVPADVGDAELANLATSDIYWDRIEAIEYVGERQVYDLTVPEHHNFVAEDVVVHNTTLAVNMAENAAIGGGVPTAIFSMEMSAEQLSFRMIGSIGRVNQSRLRTGKLSDEDWSRIDSAVSMMSNAPIFIDDSPALTPTEVRARARRLKREHGLGLIVVDYLQLMRVAGNTENRATEISEISRSLKALAKELACPVIALSQLNRSVEQRTDKKPVMSDLRECVTGETLVCLADRRRIPIGQLVGQAPEVWSVDADRRLIRARADKVWRVGRKPVYRVRLANGSSIRATAEHRLLSASGWLTVSDLGTGARIALAAQLPGFEQSQRRAVAGSHSPRCIDDEVRLAALSDLLWDRVIDVVADGEEEVFDLTVPGPANWLADGIVTHNSGAIEQDADLIVFIYREEVYEPDTPRKGIADIIIAKQRNGPIGELRLTFLGEFTKFENLVAEAYGEGVF
jgi:replicative DNA helicase